LRTVNCTPLNDHESQCTRNATILLTDQDSFTQEIRNDPVADESHANESLCMYYVHTCLDDHDLTFAAMSICR
jgi:hypothetical protein